MVVEALDHARLVAELPQIEKMTPAERINLARQRREIQLTANMERERSMQPPRPRNPRLRFSPEVALLEATGRADLAEVEKLLREGADPNSHNEDGLTPLHQCAIDDKPEIVQLLLDYGADVNAKDTELWTPLHAAACCGYSTIVQLLINANADLVAVNADGNMPYDLCDDENTLDIIETRMANNGITQDYINECRNQPEINMLNDMKQKHQRGEPLTYRYPDGSTYLHIAAANGYNAVAAFLLRCGVEAAARDNDLWQPVHAAASWNQPELLEILCEYGAEISAITASDETPMDLATDPQTKQTIVTLQQNENARKRRLAFGVRDSRRQSRKRKKFESPQQPQPITNAENPFSARGAIRRLSLRDRSGMTLARIEAQKEQSALMRSWSKEDVSRDFDNISNLPGGQPQRAASLNNPRESPNKRILNKSNNTKVRSNAEEEWFKKLEANTRGDFEEEDDLQNGTSGLAKATRGRSSTKKKKKKPDQMEMGEIMSPTSTTALNGKNGPPPLYSNTMSARPVEKKACCCTIL